MDKYEQGILEMGILKYNTEIQGKKFQVVSFDSCDEMISKINKGKSEYGWDGKGHNYNRQYWHSGCIGNWMYGAHKTYDATLTALQRGEVCPQYLKFIGDLQSKLTENPEIEQLMLTAKTFKRKRVYADQGDELDINRLMSGEVEHWEKSTKGKKNTLIRLAFNIDGTGSKTEEDFMIMASTAAVISNILSIAGFAVQLTFCHTSNGVSTQTKYNAISVCVKQAHEQIDMERICSVGCTGFFRGWIFQVYANVLDGTPYGHMGSSSNFPDGGEEQLGFDYIIDHRVHGQKANIIEIKKLFKSIIETHN